MITPQNLEKWSEAVSQTNLDMTRLRKDRKINNDWIGTEIRAYFEELVEVDKVVVMPDASMIIVNIKGKLDLKDGRVYNFPMPMEIGLDGITLQIRIFPEVTRETL